MHSDHEHLFGLLTIISGTLESGLPLEIEMLWDSWWRPLAHSAAGGKWGPHACSFSREGTRLSGHHHPAPRASGLSHLGHVATGQ